MSKPFSPEQDIPSLAGKVILVTGGNTGIGKETVLQLAKHNPSAIYLSARTPLKAEEAISDIKSTVPSADIIFLPLDLSSFASIRDAVTTFTSQSKRLDILINNAGIMACPMGETEDGYEIQFGTNHVGHALLTKLLMPTLLNTAKEPDADVRIVNVSSSAHQMAPSGGIIFDKATLAQKGDWARYGQSKLANILFTKELAKRYPSIKSVAVHPGAIRTNLWQHGVKANTLVKYGVSIFGRLWLQDVAKGARNQLWAATAKNVSSGAYYNPVGQNTGGTSDARNEKLAAELWDWTEGELAKHGY